MAEPDIFDTAVEEFGNPYSPAILDPVDFVPKDIPEPEPFPVRGNEVRSIGSSTMDLNTKTIELHDNSSYGYGLGLKIDNSTNQIRTQWAKRMSQFDIAQSADILNELRFIDEDEYQMRLGVIAERVPWRRGITETELKYVESQARYDAWSKAYEEDMGIGGEIVGFGAWVMENIVMSPQVGGTIALTAAAAVGLPALGFGAVSTMSIATAVDMFYNLTAASSLAAGENRVLEEGEIVMEVAFGSFGLLAGAPAAMQEISEVALNTRKAFLSKFPQSEYNNIINDLHVRANEAGFDLTREEIQSFYDSLPRVARKKQGGLTDEDFRKIAQRKVEKDPDIETTRIDPDVSEINTKLPPTKPVPVVVDGNVLNMKFLDPISRALYNIARDTKGTNVIDPLIRAMQKQGLLPMELGDLDRIIRTAAARYADDVEAKAAHTLEPAGKAGVTIDATEDGLSGMDYINDVIDDIDNRLVGATDDAAEVAEEVGEDFPPLSVEDEAKLVRNALLENEGKGFDSLINITRFVSNNAPLQSMRIVAKQVEKTLVELEGLGATASVNFSGKAQQRVMFKRNQALGFSQTKLASDRLPDIGLFIKDTPEALTFRVLLHELVHNATQFNIAIARKSAAKGLLKTRAIKLVDELDDLRQEVFTTLSAADLASVSGLRNAVKTSSEFIAETLSNPDVQKKLAQIKIEGGKSVYTRLVQSIRKSLGLKPKSDDALSRVLSVSDEILKLTRKEIAEGGIELGVKFDIRYGSASKNARAANKTAPRPTDTAETGVFNGVDTEADIYVRESGERLEKALAQRSADPEAAIARKTKLDSAAKTLKTTVKDCFGIG